MSHQPTPDDTNSPPVDLLLKALPAHVPAGLGGVARLRLVLVPAQPCAELLRHAVAHLAPVLPLPGASESMSSRGAAVTT